MNTWATVGLVVLTVVVPIAAFMLGILVGDNNGSKQQKEIIMSFIVGTAGVAVTLANAIYLLS